MSPSAQRIAITKLCPTIAKIDGAGAPVWIRDTCEYFDPLEDLNAMHEAETVLVVPERLNLTNDFEDHLCAILHRQRHPLLWRSWHATAAQRAEAFLRTLGKWEESA